MHLALVLALLPFGGGQLWMALHFSLVEHAICAEHGALVHVSRSVPQAPVQERSGDQRALPSPALLSHGHCTAPPAVAQRQVEAPSAEVPPAPWVAAHEVVDLGPGALATSIALLSLAPKLSPPRPLHLRA